MAEIAYVHALPLCDLCKGAGSPAAYDVASHPGYPSWAYLCESHYQLAGSPPLGTGRGQRLVVRTTDTKETP